MADSESKTQVILPRPKFPSPLPSDFDYLDSSYFKRFQKPLPPPEQIKAANKDEHRVARGYVPVSELGLFVKYGGRATIREAISQSAVRSHLCDKVPVPEVYGWKVYEDKVYIYMELVEGIDLQTKWDQMSEADKVSIAEQLREVITALRSLQQPLGEKFIGSIDGEGLLDRVFHRQADNRSLPDLEAFYQYLRVLTIRERADKNTARPTPEINRLPLESYICFTHGDLHHNNILISASGLPKIVSVLDWGSAGWYPDWWEWVKARMPLYADNEWDWRFLRRIMGSYDESLYLDWYDIYWHQLSAW